MRVLLAALSAWFPLTTVPSVAHVDWRCGARGEQLRVVLTPPAVTTTVLLGRRSWTRAGGTFATPWVTGTTTILLKQFTEARELDATLTVRFARLGYCRPYLPPPFELRVARR
jgi:hypothetical protein